MNNTTHLGQNGRNAWADRLPKPTMAGATEQATGANRV